MMKHGIVELPLGGGWAITPSRTNNSKSGRGSPYFGVHVSLGSLLHIQKPQRSELSEEKPDHLIQVG